MAGCQGRFPQLPRPCSVRSLRAFIPVERLPRGRSFNGAFQRLRGGLAGPCLIGGQTLPDTLAEAVDQLEHARDAEEAPVETAQRSWPTKGATVAPSSWTLR